MKVSQVLHKMDRDERVLIYDSEASITKAELYDGTPRGFKRDNPLLCKTVTGIWADGDTIVLDGGYYLAEDVDDDIDQIAKEMKGATDGKSDL